MPVSGGVIVGREVAGYPVLRLKRKWPAAPNQWSGGDTFR